jgi:hypothetical protein
MAEHTPTPWRIRNDFGGGWIQGSPADGETYGDRVANLAKPKTIGAANAAFIVKAVNNHDALVEALEDLLSDADRQMKNPSHHIPFSYEKAKAILHLVGPRTSQESDT